jgi:RimJ/RimL family protein N-acetyltransferase
MRLTPLDADTLDLATTWLAEKENYQWLDFGNGTQRLTPVSLRVMAQRDIHLLRVFTADADDEPIGLVALSDIARPFKTATLWYVLGNTRYAGQGYTTRAVSKILTLAFDELALHAVNAWTVERNGASIAVLRRNHFRFVGRQRQCHVIDGWPYDRLLFDLLAFEHKEL